MLEIVEAVEGPIHLNVCLGAEEECSRQSWCPAYAVWNEAQSALTGVLRKSNIGELARVAAQNRAAASTPNLPKPN